MSEHRITLQWKRDTPDFDYQTYTRDHTVRYGSGSELCASAAPEYHGNAECLDPEQAFVVSMASCHMLTFLALASKKRFTVDSYDDEAMAELGKNSERKPAITKVLLRPVVVFSAERQPDSGGFRKLHDQAHDMCVIANSVATCVEVVVEPEMKTA